MQNFDKICKKAEKLIKKYEKFDEFKENYAKSMQYFKRFKFA